MVNKHFLKKFTNGIAAFFHKTKSLHHYRLIDISKDQKGNYYAIAQVIGKHQVFQMKPEEILANDAMTLQFSQLDIRTLTYLGYLGINSPKYKVLAKHLSTQNNKMTFSIYSKEKGAVELKTASEIIADENMLKNLDRNDIPEVAYSAGSESFIHEREEIQKLRAAKAKL